MDVAYLLVESRSFGVGDVIRIHVLENVLLVHDGMLMTKTCLKE